MNESENLISDEELLRCARECRSNSAFNELFRRYSFYAKALASQYACETLKTGIRKEEVEQVALISFYTIYKKIRINSKSFYLYWEKAAKRDIAVYFRENSYLGQASLFAGPSLDDTVFDNNDHLMLSDSIGEMDLNLRKEMIINDLMSAINGDRTKLTSNERKTILMFLNDYSMKAIAKKLNVKPSTAYRYYNNAVKKLRIFIKRKNK